MSNLTTYGRDILLKKLGGLSTVGFPTSTFLALGFDISDTGLVVEVTETEYSRQEILGSEWSITNTLLKNTETISFTSTTQNFGTPTHWGVYDTLDTGNCLFCGEIYYPKEIEAGETAYFKTDNITISMTSIIDGAGFAEHILASLLKFIVGLTDYSSETLYIGFSDSYFTDSSGISGETLTGGYQREQIVATAINGTTGFLNLSADLPFTVSGSWGADLVNMFISNHVTDTAASSLIATGSIIPMSPIINDSVVVEATAVTLEL